MEAIALCPFCLDSALTGYLPLPRELLRMEKPAAALLLYAVLLDRATLSQKNRYANETGHIYVIYPIEKLAETLSISETAVKRHLKTLSDCGLIERKRPKRNGPSQILLNLPEGSIKAGGTAQKRSWQSAKTGCHTGRTVPGNNRRKRIDWNDYYEREDDESL